MWLLLVTINSLCAGFRALWRLAGDSERNYWVAFPLLDISVTWLLPPPLISTWPRLDITLVMLALSSLPFSKPSHLFNWETGCWRHSNCLDTFFYSFSFNYYKTLARGFLYWPQEVLEPMPTKGHFTVLNLGFFRDALFTQLMFFKSSNIPTL